MYLYLTTTIPLLLTHPSLRLLYPPTLTYLIIVVDPQPRPAANWQTTVSPCPHVLLAQARLLISQHEHYHWRLHGEGLC